MPCHKDAVRRVWNERRPMSGIKQRLKMPHTQRPRAIQLRLPIRIRERRAEVACKAEPPERAVAKKMPEAAAEDRPIGLGSELLGSSRVLILVE